MKEQAVRQAKDLLITVLILTAATGIGNIFWYFSFLFNNSDYLQKARKYGHFTGYKN